MSNYTRKPRMARYEKKGLRRSLLTVLAAMLLVAVSVGGTIAWLTDTTAPVKNTFSPTDINIELWEHDYVPDSNTLDTDEDPVTQNTDYEIVPGVDLPKDPTVTVKANSEALWLFVQITESDNWLSDMTWAIDTTVQNGAETAWTELEAEGVENLYYIKVNATTADTNFNILANQQIVVADELTKTTLNSLNGAAPTLTFTAYAIQQANITTAADAWEKLN